MAKPSPQIYLVTLFQHWDQYFPILFLSPSQKFLFLAPLKNSLTNQILYMLFFSKEKVILLIQEYINNNIKLKLLKTVKDKITYILII